MNRVWLRTLNIAQFVDGVMLSLENSASSDVPNNLFVKRLIVKNSSLIVRISYSKQNVK